MGNDVYGFNAEYKGIQLVTAKEMKLVVADSDASGEEYLIQNVSISYQQPVQLIREISSGNGYYNAYPPQGMLGIERIIGEKPISAVLGSTGKGIWTTPKVGDTANRTIKLMPLDGKPGPKYTLEGCIITNVSINVDANRSLLPESVQIRFGKMTVE